MRCLSGPDVVLWTSANRRYPIRSSSARETSAIDSSYLPSRASELTRSFSMTFLIDLRRESILLRLDRKLDQRRRVGSKEGGKDEKG
jgi:hypothetical protein